MLLPIFTSVPTLFTFSPNLILCDLYFPLKNSISKSPRVTVFSSKLSTSSTLLFFIAQSIWLYTSKLSHLTRSYRQIFSSLYGFKYAVLTFISGLFITVSKPPIWSEWQCVPNTKSIFTLWFESLKLSNRYFTTTSSYPFKLRCGLFFGKSVSSAESIIAIFPQLSRMIQSE